MGKPIINHRGPEFRELYTRIIEDLRYVFQTKGDIFILTSSGTGGVECAIRNVISNGDKVIVPVNGVFSERLKEAVSAFGGTPVEIAVEWGRGVTVDQVEPVFRREKGVKAFAVVYNETSTGVKTVNLRELGRICREHDALFIVDAISILGGDELPVDEWGIDICVAGSQKCLMCPPGLALISISDKAWEAVKKSRRSYYFDLQSYKEFLERKETPYTPALPLFYALEEALKMIKEEGLERRFNRHRLCADALYAGVEAVGLRPYPAREFRSNTVIAINNPPGIEDGKFRELMRETYHVIVSGGMGKLRGSMFRVGVMGVVSQFEIMTTITAIESALSDLGYKFTYGSASSVARAIFSKGS